MGNELYIRVVVEISCRLLQALSLIYGEGVPYQNRPAPQVLSPSEHSSWIVIRLRCQVAGFTIIPTVTVWQIAAINGSSGLSNPRSFTVGRLLPWSLAMFTFPAMSVFMST